MSLRDAGSLALRVIARVCVAFTLLACEAAASPVAVTDDVGRTVTLRAPAHRIISLAPHLTEILFALGVGDEIVGTVRYADYPPAALKIPRLGDAFSVSVESVVAEKPDIVFAWRSGGSDRALARIESLGIPVFFSEAKDLDDIATGVMNIAKLVGRGERGAALAKQFRAKLASLTRQPGKHPVRVFFQISDKSLYTVNGAHLIGQSIALCGGANLFADATAPVPLVSKESVLAGRPDLVLITRAPGNPPSPWAKEWAKFPQTRGKVAYIDPNLISRPGLRMADGIARMCTLIRQAGER